MQLNSITRNSSFMAMMLAVVIIIVAFVRYSISPFEVEIADSPYGDGAMARAAAAVMLAITALLTGRLASMSGAFKQMCTLSIPLYAVMACGVALSPDILAASVAGLMTLLGLLLMLRNLVVAGQKNAPFFGSLFFGVAALIYPPCIILGVVSAVSVLLLALSLRQAVISLAGWLLPLLMTSYVMWYMGSDFSTLAENFVDALSAPRIRIESVPYGAMALVVVMAVVMVVGAMAHVPQASSLVRMRRAISLLVVTMALLLATALLPGCGTALLPVVAVPASVLLAYSLYRIPNTLSIALYWLILVVAIIHIFLE